MKQVCRLCLHENEEELISIVNRQDLSEKIKQCVSIDITEDDDLPSTACVYCIQKVNDWYAFQQACFHSNKRLLQLKHGKQNGKRTTKQRRCRERHKIGEDEMHTEEAAFEPPSNEYSCEICLQTFTSCLEYLDHQSAHNGIPVFRCDKCPEIFSTRDDLVDHDRNHKRPCPKCGKVIQKSSMKLHLVKHTDRHMCSQCNSRFNSRAALLQHVITIHTDQKDHICEACGKRFSSKTAMTVHLKSHSDERLYKCKVCEYAGRTASAVYVHMSTHAKEVCVCEVCSKIFKSTRNLNDHLRRVHSKDKKHQCSYCDKKFVDKYMLTVHCRIHTGVRPYTCDLCSKAFIRSDGLKEHMATHGERIWHDCDKCGRKFASKKGVTRHRCPGVNVA